MTIQHKTALTFTSITASILIALSSIAYFYMNMFAFQDFYKRLEIRGLMTAKSELEHNSANIREVYTEIRERHLEPLPGEREFFFPKDSLSGFIKSGALVGLTDIFYNKLTMNKLATYRIGNYFYTGLLYRNGSKYYVSIVCAQSDDSIRYARKLKLILGVCCLIGVVIAYTAGLFFSRHAFKPVRDLIDRVKTISVENLHRRLDNPGGEDEITELTGTFNEMLSRLETAFETQNNFVSNASHELRTPLTTIYGEAELALSRPRTQEQYIQSLNIIVSQSEKLHKLTDSLLSLAQTGFDGKKQNFKLVRIDELILDVKNTLNKIIPENKIFIDFEHISANESNNIVNGNLQLLKLGLTNVMENACKYSNNNVVSVKLLQVEQTLHIVIIDKGIGIPESEIRHIYDPFFRASNTGKYQGYGIGLPLTRNIFRIHKGSIFVHSATSIGTTVTLVLPIAEPV